MTIANPPVSVLNITSVTGQTWNIENKKFVSRKPAGFRIGFDESLACSHRDCSVCSDCEAKYANIVECYGQHVWVRDYEEWLYLVTEFCRVQEEFSKS